MPDPVLLYSCNSWLSWAIAERFFGGLHYCWCSPYYDARDSARHIKIPPSSSPAELRTLLSEDVARGDLHSPLIERHRRGILVGAKERRRERLISKATQSEIGKIVNAATSADFGPLLYLIPFARVRRLARPVDMSHRAHPMSAEFLIKRLPREYFDVVRL
jgi:hypothetical protein